jgi:hypothetical protein
VSSSMLGIYLRQNYAGFPRVEFVVNGNLRERCCAEPNRMAGYRTFTFPNKLSAILYKLETCFRSVIGHTYMESVTTYIYNFMWDTGLNKIIGI